ncbi:hypothetical protein ACJX0J_038197 [Zea mays]
MRISIMLYVLVEAFPEGNKVPVYTYWAKKSPALSLANWLGTSGLGLPLMEDMQTLWENGDMDHIELYASVEKNTTWEWETNVLHVSKAGEGANQFLFQHQKEDLLEDIKALIKTKKRRRENGVLWHISTADMISILLIIN